MRCWNFSAAPFSSDPVCLSADFKQMLHPGVKINFYEAAMSFLMVLKKMICVRVPEGTVRFMDFIYYFLSAILWSISVKLTLFYCFPAFFFLYLHWDQV